VIRVAGMPMPALTRLRFDQTARCVDDILNRDAQLAEGGERLGARLYELIGDPRQRAVKPALVGLRRAIHRRRRPGRAALNEDVEAALPDDLAAAVRAWVDRLRERDQCVAALPATLADETAAKVAVLRRVVAEPRFRHALVQTGSPLSTELEAWLASDADRPPPWPVLRRLAKYASRATMKTSPYSVFTVTGLAHWTGGSSPPAIRFRPDQEPCGLLELDGGVLPALETAFAGRPDLRGAMRVRLNPSAHESAGTVSFLGRPPLEPVVTLRATDEVRACMRLATERPDGTLDELLTALAANGTAGPDALPAIAAYVNRLVDAGLLELRIGVADQADDQLREVADWLKTEGNGRYAAVAATCRSLHDLVQGPTDTDAVEGHRRRLSAIRDRVDDLSEALGLASAGTRFAQHAPHESAVYRRPVADIDPATWRPVLDDLDAIRRWAGLLEPGLPLLVALGAYAQRRFAGAEVPFVRFHRILHEDLARTGDPADDYADALADLRILLGPSPSLPAPRLARLRELNQVRSQAVRAVLVHQADDDGVVRVDPRRLMANVAAASEYVSAPPSVACYVQPVARDGRLGLVLNMMTSGYGRGRSRWCRLIQRAAGHDVVAPALLRVAPNVVLAESHGAFGQAINLHLPLTPYALDYPHTVSDHPADRNIALRDLVVRCDSRTGRLGLGVANQDVVLRPVHGGMTVEYGLPPALQLLIRAFGTPTLLHPAMPVLTAGAPDDLRRANRVVAMPRIDVGGVTVRRAAWLAPYSCILRRDKGEPDSAYLLRVHAWLREHGMPTRCFVRSIAALDTPVRQIVASKARKPFYIDFDNWFLVSVFERMVHDPLELVLFTELLPAPDDALAPGPRACELIVELATAEDGDA